MPRRSPQEALAALIHDEAKEPLPPVDWQRAEARLLENIAARREPKYASTRRRARASVAAFAALAAAVVLAIAMRGHMPASTSSLPGSDVRGTTESASIDGDRAELGSALRATAHELVVAHSGRATWRLSRGGTARVKRSGEHIVIVLEQGSMLAEVTPSPVPERFAVEAGSTRVTVHGTVFRVSRTSDGVSVEVQRGTVGVRGHGGEDEVRLVAPAAARFREDGTLETPARGTPPTPAQAATGNGERSVTSQSPPKTKPPRTVRSDMRASVEPVVQTVRHCFAELTEARGDMHVSVQTSMALEALPSGRITAAVFQPPLAPAVEQCVANHLAGMRLAASQEGFQLEQSITLDR